MVTDLKPILDEPQRLVDSYCCFGTEHETGELGDKLHLAVFLETSDGEMHFRCDIADMIEFEILTRTSVDGASYDEGLVAIRDGLQAVINRLDEVFAKGEVASPPLLVSASAD